MPQVFSGVGRKARLDGDKFFVQVGYGGVVGLIECFAKAPTRVGVGPDMEKPPFFDWPNAGKAGSTCTFGEPQNVEVCFKTLSPNPTSIFPRVSYFSLGVFNLLEK